MKHCTLPLLAVILLAASCTSGTEGIFASIEREQKIVSLGGLSKTATVTSMAEFGTKFYATGGRALFSRPTAGTTWDKSTVDGSSEVAAVGTTSSAIYAVAKGRLYSSTDGSTWSDVTPSGSPSVLGLVPVRQADGKAADELILLTDNAGDRKIVYLIGSSGPGSALDLSVSGVTGLSAEVNSAVSDGTNYYLASENYLWQVPSTFSSSQKITVNGAPTSGYAGLLWNGTTLYLTTRSNGSTGGALYSTGTLGTSLTFTALSTDVKILDSAVSLGAMLVNSVNGSVWIGTGPGLTKEGNGYLELTGTSLSTTPNTSANNYTSSALPGARVGTLFVAADGSYFLGTVAHGLWKWDSAAKTWGLQ